MPAAMAPEPSRPRAGQRLHPGRWLQKRRPSGEDGSAYAFGVRLVATVALTFALVGFTSYVLLVRTLAQQQVTQYAAVQRADAKALEAVGSRATSPTDAMLEINLLLDGTSQRPGTREAVLIGQLHVITASGDGALVGTSVVDPHIDAALEHGTSFAGRESDPAKDRRDFEFVTLSTFPAAATHTR
jgi:hypothetical protein